MPDETIPLIPPDHQVFGGSVPVYRRPRVLAAAGAVVVVALLAVWGIFGDFRSAEARFQDAYNAGHFQEAADIALALAEEHPESAKYLRMVATAHTQLAVAARDRDAFGAAIGTALQAALAASQIEVTSAETERILGYIYEVKGDLDGAIDRYHRSLAISVKDSATLSRLASLMARQGKTQTAQVLFERAVSYDPQDAQARVLYALTLLSGQRYAAAMTQARAALDSENVPYAAEANRILSASLVSVGEVDEARPYAEKALELAPNSATAVENFGQLRLAELFGPNKLPYAETLAEVRTLAERAITLAPTLTMAHFLAFKAAYAQNDKAGAALHSAETLRLLPDDWTLSATAKSAIRRSIATIPTVQLLPQRQP